MRGFTATATKLNVIGRWLMVLGLLLAFMLCQDNGEDVRAGTNPVAEPGFETVDYWTFTSTMDTYRGRQTTSWETQGSRSYEIRYQAASGKLGADSAELYQDNVDLTDADAIIFDTQLYGWSIASDTLTASVYIDDTEVWSRNVPLASTVYLNESFDVSNYLGYHEISFHLDNAEVSSTVSGGRFRFDNIRLDFTSESIGLAGQNYDDTVAWITFPAGDPGEIVVDPYNNQSETQQFGDAGEAHPVTTLVNYGSAPYIMSFEVSEFENGVVESEYYLINDKGAACPDADAISNLVEFDTLIAANVTIQPGPENAKDLYLKILLSDIAGKTGYSYLTILGEKE